MTDKKAQQVKRRPKALMVTERDLEMLTSLGVARYLTAQALEWLHFPKWEERYRAWQGRGNPNEPYAVTGRLYERLKRMREVRPPLVHRIVRPVALAVDRFARQADSYVLAEAGADLVLEAGKLEAEACSYSTPRERSFQTLEHGTLIGTFYAAMRALLASVPGLSLEDWQGDHILAGQYDAVQVFGHKNPRRRDGLWPVVPDAAFWIRHAKGRQLCFLELDRGRTVESWRAKLRAYHAYQASKALKERYGTDMFVVLCATTTATQRRRLIQATGEELRQASKHYQFMLIEDIHPFTVGDRYLVAGDVQPGPRVVRNGRLHETWQVQEAPHVFIRR